MNARTLIAFLAFLVPTIIANAQFNPSRAEDQEVKRLLALPDLTMRFQAAPLDDVLRTLCEASDMAFIGLPKAKEMQTVDMTIKGNPYLALLLVSQTYGYVPLYENGLWHFSPMKEERSKLYPKVYKLKNIHINEVSVDQASLNKAAGRDTSSALPQPVNSIAFSSDISKVITDIKALLELDPSSLALNEKDATVQPQANPAAMLLSGVPSSELAVRLGNMQQTKEENLRGRIVADPDQNSLFIIATKEHHQWIQTYLDAIDIPRKLIMLETRFVEISNEPKTNLGIDWSGSLGEKGYTITGKNKDSGKSSTSSSSSSASNTNGVTSATNSVSNSVTNTTAAASGLINTTLDKAILTGPELAATLHAISTDSEAKSLLHPSQVTVNNRQVVLRNVTQQPFQSGSSSTSGGGSSTSTNETQFIPIGTTVSLLPRILDNNNVELNIMINVSDMLGYATIGDASIPITTARDYTGQAIVASGNTLAIGGLDALKNTKTTSKIPFLGSIPGIGYLFKNDSTEDSKSNLIMFITASVLNGYNGGVRSTTDTDNMLIELDKVLEKRNTQNPSSAKGSSSSSPKTSTSSSSVKSGNSGKYLLGK
jgi:type II secretory pathway component GspD/PulD (secretin)